MTEKTPEGRPTTSEARLGSGHYEWNVADDGVTWSPGLLAIYGLEVAPSAEEGFTRMVHPDDRTRVEAETSTFLERGDVYEHEFRIIRPDGEVRHILDRGVIERAEDGTPVRLAGVNLDITDRMRRENALRSAHDSFRDLVESAPVGICVADADLKVLHTNAASRAAFADGRPAEGRDLSELQHAIWPRPFAEEIVARSRETLSTGTPYRTCSVVERADPETVQFVDWRIDRRVLPDGSAGIFGYFQDLTDHHIRETALKESQERLAMTYEIAGIGAWDLDLATDRSEWSPQLYDLLGLDRSTPASSEVFFARVHPEDLAQLKRSYFTAIETGGLLDTEFRIVRPDGAIRHIAGMGRVVSKQNGRPGRMIGVNFDVSDKWQAIQELRLVMREVNHRSKNLLSLVQAIARQTARMHPENFLGLLEDRLRALAAAQDMLVRDEFDGAAMTDLVNSQLDYLGDLIGSRVRMTGPDVQITAEAAQTLGMAIFELATNASKHGALSDAEGIVEIAWALPDSAPGKVDFTLSWTERNGPPVTPPARRGFGWTVLNQVVRHALAAEVETEFAPTGFSWRMRCGGSCLHLD